MKNRSRFYLKGNVSAYLINYLSIASMVSVLFFSVIYIFIHLTVEAVIFESAHASINEKSNYEVSFNNKFDQLIINNMNFFTVKPIVNYSYYKDVDELLGVPSNRHDNSIVQFDVKYTVVALNQNFLNVEGHVVIPFSLEGGDIHD
ncbi:hypothetical protein [Vibrio mediterranei]|uniref:hypothetical protein n=1 Tax=Vibrio mediterranei TaxID=689 RepID=UPI00148CD8A8|nr:hypothetical protein [Vibrio mediterranei]NOI26602.1 hypothetical protein [Vibrio mediterranei]